MPAEQYQRPAVPAVEVLWSNLAFESHRSRNASRPERARSGTPGIA
jgi:hypothetical protein